MDVRGYLQSKGLVLKAAGARNVHTTCLFCAEDPAARGRLYINIDPDADVPGLYMCHRCGARGSLTTLKRHYGDTVNETEVDLHTRSEIFRVAAAYYRDQLRQFTEVVTYLTGPERGLHVDTLKAHDIGYAPMDFSYDVTTGQTTTRWPARLYSHLRTQGYESRDILATGLCQYRDDHPADALGGMITIPYHASGNVVAIRGRTWPHTASDFEQWAGDRYEPFKNKYKTPSGTSARLFNSDAAWNTDEVYITEGECFPGDAEVLTPEGWVRLDKYVSGLVLQVNPDMSASFVTPITRVEKSYEGALIVRSNQQCFYSCTTPDHNLVSIWNEARGERLRKAPAVQTQPGQWSIPRCVTVNGPGIPLTDDQIRLALAVAADATIDVRRNTRRAAANRRYCRCGLRKQRKIDALCGVLDRLGIEYSANVRPSDGLVSVCFSIPDGDYDFLDKNLPVEWIEQATISQRRFICSEQALWDGNHVPDRRQLEFSSARWSQASWMQTIASTAGYTSTIMTRCNQWGEWFKVSLLLAKQTTSWQSIGEAEGKPHSGPVYCVQVPTGMILVRQNGCISVSGNCDALVLEQHGYPAMGVPGADAWQIAWDDYLTPLKRVWLVYDRDAAGEKGAAKLADRVGTKIRRVHLSPEGTKCDPTMFFADHTRDDFQAIVDGAAKGGMLVTVTEAVDEFEAIQHEPGIRFGWDLLDIMIAPGLQAGQIMILLAKTGTGKSLLLFNLLQMMRMVPEQQEFKILLVSLEQTRGEWWDRARRIHRFYNVNADEYDAQAWWQDHILLVDQNRVSEPQIRQVLDDFDYHMGGPPHLVAIDYLGYWARSFRGEPYERVSAAAMALKAIAKDHRIPMIVPHQVSRIGRDGEEFGADAARDSGVVEETADFLLTMWNPDNTLGREEVDKSGLVHLRIAKSRHGGRGQLLTMQQAPISLVMVPEGNPLCGRARQEVAWRRAYRSDWDEAVFRHRTGIDGPIDNRSSR